MEKNIKTCKTCKWFQGMCIHRCPKINTAIPIGFPFAFDVKEITECKSHEKEKRYISSYRKNGRENQNGARS